MDEFQHKITFFRTLGKFPFTRNVNYFNVLFDSEQTKWKTEHQLKSCQALVFIFYTWRLVTYVMHVKKKYSSLAPQHHCGVNILNQSTVRAYQLNVRSSDSMKYALSVYQSVDISRPGKFSRATGCTDKQRKKMRMFLMFGNTAMNL